MQQTALRAKSIGSLAASELSRENQRVEVTSTFPSSLYIKTENALVFVTNRHLRSPITVNLDSTKDLDRLIHPSDYLYIREREIRTERGVTIYLGQATVYETPSEFVCDLNSQFGDIAKHLRSASFILEIIDTCGSVLDPSGLVHDGVAAFVRNGILSLRSDVAGNSFLGAALKIVGAGYGFTPSGDDFLGGFLAGYNSLARSIKRDPIHLEVKKLRERTSWISATLLDYMQRQVLDEQLREVIACAAEGRFSDFLEAVEALLPRGHTSGIDFSTGLILALSLIRDLICGERETERIAARLKLGAR